MPFLNADRRAILGITLLWAFAILLIRPTGNFPLNDDWSWALAVDAVVTHHTWHLTDFTGMPLATQIVWGAIFCLPGGFSFVALRLSTLVLGWAGLVGIYTLLSECGGSRRLASVGTLAVLLSPCFFALSLSFMTDVPFLACAVWALVFTLRYQRDERLVQFAAIVALLVAATLNRQIGVALTVAIALSLAVFPGRRLHAAVAAAVPVATLAAYNAAIDHFGAPYSYHVRSDTLFSALRSGSPLVARGAGVAAVGMFVWLGVLMLPVVLASRLTPWRSRGATALGAALVLVPGAVTLYKHQWMPINQNILRDVGLNAVLLTRGELWPHAPHWLWIAITLTGLICAAGVGRELVLRAVRDGLTIAASRRSAAPVVTLCASFVLSATPLWFVPTFDRYYLLPFVLLLALWTRLHAAAPPDPTRPRWTAASAMVLGGLWLFDTAALHDSFAFNTARWAAVDALRTTGLSGDDIDGGFEVNGLLSYHMYAPFNPDTAWYKAKTHPGALVALGPVDGYSIAASYAFRRWLPPGSGVVYALRPVAGVSAGRPR